MYDVIIIGAGPAGLFCANHVKDKNIVILEKKKRAGMKLLLTGGGRCNLTNLKDQRAFLDEIEHNKKSLYSAIANFGPYDIYDYFDATVPLKVESEDCVFPVSNKANDILQHLLQPVRDCIIYNQAVTSIKPCDDYYEIHTNNTVYQTKNVVVSTGGASYKVTGSSGDHMRFARGLDITTVDLFPAETSIILQEKNDLAGTSFEHAAISFGKVEKRGHLLFTHKGLSGHSAMKSSEFVYLQKPDEIYVDFDTTLQEETIREAFEQHRESKPTTVLSKFFTKKFSDYLISKTSILPETKNKQLIHRQIDEIIQNMKQHPYQVSRVDALEKAYVTGGGISVKELTMKTFESKKYPGLYFIGECVDIHGPVGGYNLTLAFSSAMCAAKAINITLES